MAAGGGELVVAVSTDAYYGESAFAELAERQYAVFVLKHCYGGSCKLFDQGFGLGCVEFFFEIGICYCFLLGESEKVFVSQHAFASVLDVGFRECAVG